MSAPSEPGELERAVMAVERAQGRLLSLLENREVPLTADPVEEAARTLGAAVDSLSAQLSGDSPDREALNARLRRAANNHAVLGARLERRRELLVRDLGRTRMARRVLQSNPGDAAGGSCDVAG